MPAANCAMPPYARARPSTTASPVPMRPALNTDSTNVVSAKAARPSGPGSAIVEVRVGAWVASGRVSVATICLLLSEGSDPVRAKRRAGRIARYLSDGPSAVDRRAVTHPGQSVDVADASARGDEGCDKRSVPGDERFSPIGRARARSSDSGTCRRTITRPTSAGMPAGVASETPTMTVKASGTVQAAG